MPSFVPGRNHHKFSNLWLQAVKLTLVLLECLMLLKLKYFLPIFCGPETQWVRSFSPAYLYEFWFTVMLIFFNAFLSFSKLLYVCSRGMYQVMHLLAWLRKLQILFSNLEFKDLNSWESNSCRSSQSPVAVRECVVVLSYGFWCHNGLYAILDFLYIYSLSVYTFAISDNFYGAF